MRCTKKKIATPSVSVGTEEDIYGNLKMIVVTRCERVNMSTLIYSTSLNRHALNVPNSTVMSGSVLPLHLQTDTRTPLSCIETNLKQPQLVVWLYWIGGLLLSTLIP